MSKKPFSVLFVCLGNICRSPLAEGVFQKLIDENGLKDAIVVDSCGTGSWHIGDPPHHETRKNAKKNGLSLDHLRARQVNAEDLNEFDLVVAMDNNNKSDLESFPESVDARIVLLREYDEEEGSLDVPDPYFGGIDGFQEVYEIVTRCCDKLLLELKKEL